MISLQNVSKWYHGDSKVLDQVNLNLNKGDFVYVVGGSGAGKTSLLKLISTEDRPSMGTVSLFGYDLAKVKPRTLRAMRRAVATIPQDIRLIPDLTVIDNVMLSSQIAGRQKSAREYADELLSRLGLAHRRNVNASALSGGEAQRVAVARALVRNPEILIADEPTGAQDRENTWSLMDLFVKANLSGTTVLVATHDREIVRRVRKKCAVLNGGHVVFKEGMCFY